MRFSSRLYFTISCRMSFSFSCSCDCRHQISFSFVASLVSQQSFIATSFSFIRIFSFERSSSIAADDSSCIVSRNPARRPTSCCRDFTYRCRNQMSFYFWKVSFQRAQTLSRSYLFYRASTSLGVSYLSAIIFWLFLSNYYSSYFLSSFSQLVLAASPSLNPTIYDLSWLISSPCSSFIIFIVSQADAISLSLPRISRWNFFFSASKNQAPFCFCSVSRSSVWEVSSIFVPRLVICSRNYRCAAANLTLQSWIFALYLVSSVSKLRRSRSFSCRYLCILSRSDYCCYCNYFICFAWTANSLSQYCSSPFTSAWCSWAILIFRSSTYSRLSYYRVFILFLNASINLSFYLFQAALLAFISDRLQYSFFISSVFDQQTTISLLISLLRQSFSPLLMFSKFFIYISDSSLIFSRSLTKFSFALCSSSFNYQISLCLSIWRFSTSSCCYYKCTTLFLLVCSISTVLLITSCFSFLTLLSSLDIFIEFSLYDCLTTVEMAYLCLSVSYLTYNSFICD